MSEATVVLQETLPKKSEKAPNAAKDGNGETWKSWDVDFAGHVGKRVKLVYEQKSREYQGRTFTDNIVSAVEEAPAATTDNGDTPPLGTGEYIKGQTAPSDSRRILGCVAWERGVQLTEIEMRHKVGAEITPALIQDAAQKHANYVFVDLLRKGRMLEDEDIPF